MKERQAYGLLSFRDASGLPKTGPLSEPVFVSAAL
jgi:hypothetical protein